ncbi:MspA family porin [Mycolicibacterium sp. S2-37]|uniref:MspA family porin n=1 Tax=Mycolicibacterium sp. S2-37 TaxID=2810297 RepID=UPI001A94F309|nr:MspA family porin [Mycolicibacterium sp. S2-37]MBO0677558.1 MspA family porin [Mycolicibacterium sp. S2-37]
MFNRLAALAAVCAAAPVIGVPTASAQPVPPPPPPPDTGVVASAPPGVVTTPDGWVLTVAAANETQLPVAPLTTAVSSREYLVGGTFTGTVTGDGSTKLNGGVLEAGYQIGCGIELGQVRLIGSVGLSTSGSSLTGGIVPTGVTLPISGTLEIHLKPGTVQQVSVSKKSFKAAPARVTVKDTHIKIDGCTGQSFLRSYATLTSSTTDTDDIVAYYGVTKTV